MNTEQRIAQNKIEVRNDGAGKWLDGYAALYGSLSNDLGGFKERIAPGAFRSVMEDDCRCLLNHDPNTVLGRSKSGTLILSERADGLHYSCLLPDTQAARDLHASVSRGDIDQCSFSFAVGDSDCDWDEATDDTGSRFVRRTIRSFKRLFDVSPVTYPAYENTQVSARALVPEAVLVEARRMAQQVGLPVAGLQLPSGLLIVPGRVPYRPMTDDEIAAAVDHEKGIRARTFGESETAVERFIRKEREKDHAN